MQETNKVLAVINNYRLNSLTQLVYTMVIWINQYNLFMHYSTTSWVGSKRELGKKVLIAVAIYQL